MSLRVHLRPATLVILLLALATTASAADGERLPYQLHVVASHSWGADTDGDVLDKELGYTLVVTGEFDSETMSDRMRRAVANYTGRVALIDGTTQLRVGVQRPRVILPAGD